MQHKKYEKKKKEDIYTPEKKIHHPSPPFIVNENSKKTNPITNNFN